jgi:penicillin-binding protein 2
MNYQQQFGDRKFIIGGFFILIVLVYACRLFYMQVIDGSYEIYARNNALSVQIEFPPRGVIYDRNGKALVTDQPSYDLMVTPKEAKNCDTMALCEVLGISRNEFLKRIKKASQAPNSPRKQSIFEKQVSPETYARLQEKEYRFNGFYVQKRSARNYPRPIAAHLLGYVGEVTKEKAEKDPYYNEGDYIGVTGMERSYETVLRGKKGKRFVIKDVHNKEIGRFRNGELDTAAVAGKPLYSSLDMTLQEYGETLMKGKIGAVVAIEPSTGEILALISAPSYDPNLLVGGKERAKNFPKLRNDSTIPLFNRALMAMYPPGSVFKLIDALIAQHDGVINRETRFPCAMGYPPMGGKPKCHSHGGAADLVNSVAYSCNSYYSYVFKEICDQKRFPKFVDGFAHWREMVMTFGPGTRLGTDLPFDMPGNVPSVKYYNKVFGEGRWFGNTIVSLGIGQAELTLVPLQMANVVAIVANRGYYITPHCVKGVGKEKFLDEKYKEKHYTAVTKREYYENVIDGMEKCFNQPGGTAYHARVPGVLACGKTGTAENPHGKSHAVFMAFAPRENPKIAIACLIQNAGFGGTWSAPIVSLMIEKYMTGKISRPEYEKRIKDVDLIRGKNLLTTAYH